MYRVDGETRMVANHAGDPRACLQGVIPKLTQRKKPNTRKLYDNTVFQ